MESNNDMQKKNQAMQKCNEILNKEEIRKVEDHIDSYLIDILRKDIPRNKFIYHCNLAYIDIAINMQVLFTFMERHVLFALDCNTFIAHEYLEEETRTDFYFDNELYKHALTMMLESMQYSMLCEQFPLLHANKATIEKYGKNKYKISKVNLPRKNQKFINEHSMRKALSYVLQNVNGQMVGSDDEDIVLELSKQYTEFWSENLLYEDFEPYNRLDWGGISFFLVNAAMRRFNKLYKYDFNTEKIGLSKLMIVMSQKGIKELKEYTSKSDDKVFKKALEDNTYRPIGFGAYPKISVADAPMNKTKDGYYFINPLTLIFTSSHDTRYLNFLRKTDKERYMTVKDKIKERVIPLVQHMIKYIYPTADVVINFKVPMPDNKKPKRECDILVVFETGQALYIEVKHFYYPNSFSESKTLDSELKKSQKKLSKQLEAISKGWDYLKNVCGVRYELNEIKGVIATHQYKGYDVPIEKDYPIITHTELFEEIAKAPNFNELFGGFCESESIHENEQFFMKKEMNVKFAGQEFLLEVDLLDPMFESLFAKAYAKQIYENIKIGGRKEFRTIKDLAKGYVEVLRDKTS